MLKTHDTHNGGMEIYKNHVCLHPASRLPWQTYRTEPIGFGISLSPTGENIAFAYGKYIAYQTACLFDNPYVNDVFRVGKKTALLKVGKDSSPAVQNDKMVRFLTPNVILNLPQGKEESLP